jgi:hypothetical protein
MTCGAVAAEQFGYGFSHLHTYMLSARRRPQYLLRHLHRLHGVGHDDSRIRAAVADLVGYRHFFIWVIAPLPGLTIALLLNRKIDPQFGKKTSH